MSTETGNFAEMEGWKNDLIRKGLKPGTIRLKIQCAARCLVMLDGADPSQTTADDLRRMSDALGNISGCSKDRLLRYFNDYLVFAHGISPYEELRSDYKVGSKNNLTTALDAEPKLEEWRQWQIDHGRDREKASQRMRDARRGFIHLMERHPGITPERVTPEMVLAMESAYPALPQRVNMICNCTASFAEWAGAGPVQTMYHDLRSNRSWESRVFSGRFGDRIRSYYNFMVEHYFRPSTCVSQVNAVVYAIRIIEEVIGPFELEEITAEDLFEVRFNQRSVSETTLRTYLTVFGQFVDHCIGSNPYSDRLMRWNSGMVSRRIFLSQEEFMEIARQADPTERIIVVLGATLGLRKMEIVNLMLEDVGPRFIHVRGKGSGPQGKTADQVLDPDTSALIDEYLQYRRKVIDTYGDFSCGRLVISDRGITAGHPFTLEGIASFVRQFSDRVGIRFSCHCFRRYYATSLYDSGIDLNMIRTMMRHTKLDTTLDRYINVDTRKMVAAQSAIGSVMRGAMAR